MDLKRINNLPMMEAIDPANAQAGFMRRPMVPEDSTDGGIIDRIKQATMKGLINPKVAEYLMENLLQNDADTNQAIGGMPPPANMPEPGNVVPQGLLSNAANTQQQPMSLEMARKLKMMLGQ